MKKTTLLSSIIIAITSILLSANSNAQTLVNQEWVTTGANPNYHFQYFNAASNNGYLYLVGNSYHTAQQENFIIGKMDDQGNWLWFREYNSISNYKDFGIDIFAKDSFIYVTGISWDSVSNNSEIVTMRIDDSTGNILWSQTWGSRYNVAVKVIADNAGNIYVGGTAQTAVSEFGMVVLKYKPTGSFEWESIYDSTGIMEGAVTMLLDSPQTNITITGYSGNTTNNWNFATIEMDAASGSIKTSTITNNGSGGFSSPVGISKDHNDATFIAGTVANPTTGKAQMKLIAYDDQWNVNFIRIWGDSTTSTEAADYHFDFNGGKTLLGNHTRSNGTKEIVLVRYESDPAQFMWARTLASPVQGEDAIGASFCFGGDNDNIYLTGSFGTNSHHRMITAAYTNTGDLLWLKEFNRTSTSDDQGKTIQTDELGNPLVTGVSIDADTAVYVSVKYNQAETFFPPDTELAALPFAFYENKGQIINDTLGVADGVNYYTNTANPRIYLQNRQLSYVMNRIDSLQDSLQRIDLVFLGNPATKYSSGETKYYPNSKVNPYLNYYIGGLTNFQEHVEGYERIVEKNLYNNIDWHIYSNNSGLKYYFVVLPGGDPSDIVFKYLGATSVTSNSDSIIINTLFGTLIQAPFEAIQYNSTTATHISISCNSLGNSEFSFTLGSYDPNKPLYIKVGSNIQNITQSMANLQWSTYIGGGVIDEASKVRIDQNGNQFLCGNTESTNFPTTPGLVTNTNGLVGLFLTKYSTSNDIVWSTYYGGTQSLITDNQMNATSLAIQNSVDICGGGFSIFVGGSTTYSNLPLPGNGVNHNTTLASTTYPDMFITRFSGQSGIINYGTLIGSNGSDIINDMEVNEFTHNLFFVGYTNGSNFPYTNAFSGSGNFYDNAGKGIIGQLDCSMNFLWLTGYGSPTNGTCIDASPATNVKDIAFDTQKNIIISGGTPSAIPNTGIYAISNPSGSYYANRTAPTNCEDNGFIAKFTLLSGTNNKYQLYYKTHYGGSIESFCPAITSNSNDEIIFTTMGSPSGFSIFPNGSSLTTPNSRLFFSRFDKDGLPIYSNQVKSNNAFISSNEIKCNANNYCYIIGERYGSQGSIITANKTGYYYDDLDVGKKSVLIEVDPTNQVSWLSLFGGQTVEKGNSLDFFQNHLFICGETKSDQSSTDPFKKYPLADDGGYFDDSYNGNWDAYIAKLDISIATAIHDLDNNMIVNPIIYPNPNNGSFFIDFSSIKQKVYKAEITNTMGQLVFEETGPTKNLIPINTKLSNGIYIVSVCLDSTIYKYKIIINK